MRKFSLMLAFSCVSVGFSGMASAQSLEAADCRPLTQENAQACCAAENWQDLIRARDEDVCRRLGFDEPFAAALPSLNLPETPDAPDTPDPPDPTNPPGGTASLGNPGNEPGINGPDREVGRSGENPPRDGGGGFGESEAKGNSQ